MRNFLFILCIAGVAFWLGSKNFQKEERAEFVERAAERAQMQANLPVSAANNSSVEHQLGANEEVSASSQEVSSENQFASPLDSTDVSLASFLSNSGDSLLFNSSHLENYNAMDFHYAITNLDYVEDKTNLSYEVEQELDAALSEYQGASQEAVRCSGSVCGIMFSGNTRENISEALDGISRNERLNDKSKGGVLRYIEENGVHYGVLIMVIGGDQPLSLTVQ